MSALYRNLAVGGEVLAPGATFACGSVTVPAGVELCHLPSPLRLSRGGELHGAVLAFERQGPKDAPTVVVLGGISAGCHVSAHVGVRGPGWWEGFVGDGLAIDTTRLQVLAIDWLGGIGASSGPAGSDGFPFVGTDDQADAILQLLDVLGIRVLHGWVGSSYGGMVGLQFAARHPARLRALAAIGAAHRSHPLASGWRSVQRRIVELGVQQGFAAEAIALARQLAMTTYRSAAEFEQRFPGAPTFGQDGKVRFPVEDYLAARGAEFAQRFPPGAFLCLNASIDAHRVAPSAVVVPTWLCSFDSDQLVPPWLVRELAAGLGQLRRHRELHSIYGHDAFLKERYALQGFLQEVLS
jgi:homoserine O-acetyltransferase